MRGTPVEFFHMAIDCETLLNRNDNNTRSGFVEMGARLAFLLTLEFNHVFLWLYVHRGIGYGVVRQYRVFAVVAVVVEQGGGTSTS